jgi:hypothetical protein
MLTFTKPDKEHRDSFDDSLSDYDKKIVRVVMALDSNPQMLFEEQ